MPVIKHKAIAMAPLEQPYLRPIRNFINKIVSQMPEKDRGDIMFCADEKGRLPGDLFVGDFKVGRISEKNIPGVEDLVNMVFTPFKVKK